MPIEEYWKFLEEQQKEEEQGEGKVKSSLNSQVPFPHPKRLQIKESSSMNPASFWMNYDQFKDITVITNILYLK